MLLLLQFQMLDKNNEQGLLSHYFKKKLIKNRKLNLFGKAITTIDLINKDKQQVHTLMELDLSHNAIDQLANISQFNELQILKISHNKIEQQTQLQKIFMLPHLHTLQIRNNPILKTTPSIAQLRVLLGFNTDVYLMSSQIEQKISKLVSQTQLLHRYYHYYKQIRVHQEFFKEKVGLSNYEYINGSTLPKIKRLFQQNLHADKTLRKYIIYKLDSFLFQEQKDLILQLDRLNKNTKKKVSEIIMQISYFNAELSSKKIQKFQTNKIVKCGKTISQLPQRSKPFRPKQNIKHGISKIKLSPNKSLSIQNSYFRKQKSTFEGEMQSNIVKLSDFQNQFTSLLTRIHPSFQLLHSPLPSLKSHQKDLLIEQLLNTLKDSIKSNIKLKNAQSENNQLKEQIKELKKHLGNLTLQVTQHTKNLNERIKELQSEYEQQLGRAQLLEMESKRRLLENDLQREVIEKFKEQTKVKNNQNQSLLKDIQSYERISQLRTNAIKKRNLNILLHRALHYAKIKQLRNHNQNSYNSILKQQVLYSLKINLFLKFYQQKIRTKIQSRHLKSLLQKNHYAIKNRQSQKQVGSSLKIFRVKLFLQKLKYLKQQEESYKQDYQKVVNKYRSFKICYFLKNINSSIFNHLSQKQQKRVNNHKRYFFLKSVFKSWNIYVYQLKQKQQKCEEDYSHKMKSIVIKDFIATMLYEIGLNSKSIAVHNFLPNIRKIKGYLTFTKKLSQILLKRSINIGKILLQKKNNFLQFFISAMKDRILKKGLKKERQKQLKKIQQKQLQVQKRNIRQKNKQRKKFFALQMSSITQKLRSKILQRQISTSLLEGKVTNKYMARFISKIRSFYIQHLRINKKITQIESYRFAMYKCRKVFTVLGRIQYFKNNQKKKLSVLQMKIFYNWKIMFKQHSVIIFREKYHQIQAEVDSLKEKQLKSQQQKEIYFKKLDQKDKLYQQCIKKSQQLEFLLESKQIKYENLKSIFYDTLQLNQHYKQKYEPLTQQVTTTKVPVSKNKFLKCMQQQIRKDLTAELDKQHNNKDRFLYQKDRNLQFKQKLYNNQNRQQLQQKTQRFSFVSSFKRF